MKTHCFILFLILAGSYIFAQTPEAFKYQAVIGDGSGEIIANTTVSLKISVLRDSDQGAVVYEETFHPTTNDHGLVDVEIGDGSFYSIDWGATNYFLKIEVDPANGSSFTHLGTSPLLSVPYALHARNVEVDLVDDADADPANELQNLTLDGTDLTLSQGGGTVTLPSSGGGDNWGTQVVESDATLSGDGTGGDPLSVVGDLTDDQTLSLVGNDLSISDGNSVVLPSGADDWGSQVVESDATLSGDGTSGDPLGVVGDLTDDQLLSYSGGDLSITGGNTVAIPSTPWQRSGSDIYYSAGNIGINTSNPQELFHVNGAGMFEFYSGSMRLSTPGSWPGIISYIQTGERRDIAFRDFGISITASTTSSSPGLTDGLWVNPGGNVGIGTWGPGDYPLMVNERTEWGLSLRHASSGNIWEIFSSSDGGLYLYRNSSDFRGYFNSTTGVYTPVSDRRFKKNIRPLRTTLDNLKQIKPSTYSMKSGIDDKREIGIVAQELMEYYPELVYEVNDKRNNRTLYTVNYDGIAVVAVKAIQEQQEIIEQQARTIQDQSDRIEDLERKFELLQKRLRQF